VSLEFIKVAQAYFIDNDVEMFSFERDKLAKCSSTSIVEDLG
jgi:phospholipid-transporting ATPase